MQMTTEAKEAVVTKSCKQLNVWEGYEGCPVNLSPTVPRGPHQDSTV